MRVMLRFLFSAIGLLVASSLVPGITHGSFLDLIVVAVLLGALNATLGATLKALAFIPMACTLGCLGLVINGFVFWLLGILSERLGLAFGVHGFWAGFLGALVTALVASILDSLFLKRNQPRPPENPRPIKIVN